MYRRHRARESALEQWSVRWARSKNIIVGKLTECVGIPDRIFFTPGMPVIIEFKAEGKSPEKLQPLYLEKLRNDGYRAEAVSTKDEFLAIMRGVLDTVAVPTAWSEVSVTGQPERFASGPGNGKDKHDAGGRKDSKKKEDDKARADRGTTARRVRRMAR